MYEVPPLKSHLKARLIVLFLMAIVMGMLASHPKAYAADNANFWQTIQKQGYIRAGAAVAPPYVIRDPVTGKYSGVFVDVLNEFAKDVLGVRVKYISTTWDNAVAGLQANRWDVVLALNARPKRALSIVFTKPLVNFEISFLYNKNNKKLAGAGTAFSSFDKKGVIMAVQSGTAQEHALVPRVKHATIKEYPTIDATRMAVISGRADLIVDGSKINNTLLVAHKDWAVNVIPEPALTKEGISFAFPISVTANELAPINLFIEKLRITGKAAELMKKYSETIAKNAASG